MVHCSACYNIYHVLFNYCVSRRNSVLPQPCAASQKTDEYLAGSQLGLAASCTLSKVA